MLLHAFFLAAVQMLVYAGAVMVLFLFVIMLLDLKEEERRKIKRFGIVAGTDCGRRDRLRSSVRAWRIAGNADRRTAQPTGRRRPCRLGKLLFTQYLLPFEIVSVLLLVAMVGVILLSKKDLK